MKLATLVFIITAISVYAEPAITVETFTKSEPGRAMKPPSKCILDHEIVTTYAPKVEGLTAPATIRVYVVVKTPYPNGRKTDRAVADYAGLRA